MAGLWTSEVMLFLTRGMDAATLKQRVHAHNLSNVNTPHFKRSYVEFTSLLHEVGTRGQKALAVTNPGHLNPISPDTRGARVVQDTTTSMRSDGNNVDMDKEMTEIAMNQLYYNALSQQLNERLGMMRYVVNEGRR